jgi:uncharacterized membrane protein (UPF0182 family)
MQYDLLYTESEVLFGAGWTDLHIWLWVYRVLAFFSIVAAITIPVAVLKRKTKLGVAVPVIMVAIFLIGSLSAMIVQNIIVAPDAIDKEGPYLKNNIEFTQKAYDLNKVSIKDFKAEDNLTSKDIQNNDATFKNIRINDYQQAQKFYNQVQNIRRYYYFNDVDVDRYTINGEYTQTFLSAREIDESKVDNQWINKHIKYTHGYGATISRVDKVTDNGQPDVMVKDIPPKSSFKELEITQPGIYFGELTNNYILVDTKEDEFDYPDGSTNIYTKYEGNAGIKLNFFNRVLFSIKERSLKLLVSSNIDKNSKIVINRNIQARVSKIMPKLSYSDPYAITVNGKLYWIIDGYTSSTNFPYSEPLSEAGGNYIRNSVKVVIDAYNGDTVYYLVDNKDPVANTVKKIYPTLFQSADKMPAEIKEHIRYPHTMLKIQSEIYRRYHVNDVKVFYQQEDTWSVSNELSGTEEITMTPSYYILKLPGEKKEEFVSSIPYTPKDKKNMTGLLVARNDGDNYGELVLYQFPKTRTILGPMQIEAQINQDTTISKEFSLWDNSGSSYSRGNLFVIPVEDSLCYVEPIYLEASNSSLPEVKRVIVYYKNRISYKPTLAEALDDMFGSGSSALFDEKADSNDNTNKNAEKVKTRSELIQEASDLYEDAQADLKKGDLGGYADKVDKIGKLLGELGASQADADDENLGT